MTIDHSILTKKQYIKPEVSRIVLDKSFVLMQLSNPGDPRGGGSRSSPSNGNNDPFASPFGDKPFS